MNSNVTCDMISFDSLGVAVAPGTGQTEVVCRLASNMFLTYMFLNSLANLFRMGRYK